MVATVLDPLADGDSTTSEPPPALPAGLTFQNPVSGITQSNQNVKSWVRVGTGGQRPNFLGSDWCTGEPGALFGLRLDEVFVGEPDYIAVKNRSDCAISLSPFRASVIEWMMTNHPHDCPVCDEGGECHLQDMTLMTGHNYRAYRFPKKTYENQDLGPFVNHEMNRCIQCYRCVHYYKDIAGGKDLQAIRQNHNGRGGHVGDRQRLERSERDGVPAAERGISRPAGKSVAIVTKGDRSDGTGVAAECRFVIA